MILIRLRRFLTPGTGERGAAAVEFALVLPVFLMLVFGMFTGGIAYNQKQQISHSAREGARYGATIPQDQFGPGNGAGWATSVKDVTVGRSEGDLSVTGATVCVALVSGTAGTVVSGATPYYYNGTFPYGASSGSAARCFDDSASNDASTRVQVVVGRPGSISAIFVNINVTLTSKGISKYEVQA